MATKFLDPGGDANFGVGSPGTNAGFWEMNNTPAIATDFVHGTHVKSIKFRANTLEYVNAPNATIGNTGARISFWVYFAAMPTSNTDGKFFSVTGGTYSIYLRVTAAGVLQATHNSTQIGSNGSTLSTGTWYRICFSYTTGGSDTVNESRFYLNGVLDITASNANLGQGITTFNIGNQVPEATMDFRLSDVYADDSTALTDTGNIWVTAKRPNANGTLNEFTTQIGAGGSGYGSGHSPQVNERAWSQTNGWSLSNTTIKTEEYTLESVSQGDIDITGATIVDFMGWITSSVNSTANSPVHKIIVAGVSTSITESTSTQLFTQFAGSTTYPSTGAAIGVSGQYTTTAHLTRLFDCGIVVAYIPVVPSSIKTVMGLAKASVKAVGGLAIASTKTINDLA